MLKGFREFVLRGNVVELAVAVVMGAAFGAVVTSLVSDVLTPLIASIVGKPDFSALVADVNGAQVAYGKFLNALISFLMIALAVYLFVVAPLNSLEARRRRGEPRRPNDEAVSRVPQRGAERGAALPAVRAADLIRTPAATA